VLSKVFTKVLSKVFADAFTTHLSKCMNFSDFYPQSWGVSNDGFSHYICYNYIIWQKLQNRQKIISKF